MNRPVLGTAEVTVSCGGLGSTGTWSVAIDGQEVCGGEEARAVAESALWNIPEAGGSAVIGGCGSIRVPHQAAGRVASITLADLAMVYGGDTVTLAVEPAHREVELQARSKHPRRYPVRNVPLLGAVVDRVSH